MTTSLPEILFFGPPHPSEAVHELAFMAFQFSVAESPIITEGGRALSMTFAGGPAGIKTTETDHGPADPPVAFQHSMSYDIGGKLGVMASLPPAGFFGPSQPGLPPDPQQEEALVVAQVRVVEFPSLIGFGATVIETVATGGAAAATVTVAVKTLVIFAVKLFPHCN